MSTNNGFDVQTVLDAVTEGVIAVDTHGTIALYNRAAADITGVPAGEALGRPCRGILHADCCNGTCPLEKTIRTGETLTNWPVAIVDGQGNRRTIQLSTGLLTDGAGRVLGAVETFRDLTPETQPVRAYACEDMLSINHAMQQLFELLPNVADSTSTVLIVGESGTGKELFARAIHRLGPRNEGPFVAVNCGALPDTLLESELFGYKAGAFTDAKKDKPGRFQLAQGGTLFLDEIGDISPALQVRLLRAVQDKQYEPLGGTHPLSADVRLIAATNRDLEDMVENGRFRRDLYYRLDVVRITVPPLRDRMEDIPVLVDHFISRFNKAQGKRVAGVTDAAMACLMAHTYPGNVRELENIVERAFVLLKDGFIDVRHLPESLQGGTGLTPEMRAQRTLKEVEAAFIRNALNRNQWNRARTARQLKIHKTTLFRKMKALGIRENT